MARRGWPAASWRPAPKAALRLAVGPSLHLDVAFPLDGPDDLRGVQWLVKTRTTF